MTKLLAAVMVAFASILVGCGGGGNDNSVVATPTTPTAPAPLPVVVPDVTFTQVATKEMVTPGETFRPVLITVTCPLMDGAQSCKKTLPLGEVGFTSDLNLQNVKLLHDGVAIMGFFNQEGSLYRFTPTGYNPIWQPGVIEVVATLLPTAPDGAKTVVVVQAADSSIDKTLSVVPGETTVTVKSLSYNAPATVTLLPGRNWFLYSCPASVNGGCRLDDFTYAVNGAAVSSEVQINIDLGMGDMIQTQLWTDSYGYLSAMTGIGYTVPPGGTIIVKVLSTPGQYGVASVWFQDFKSWSGDKQIEPIVPSSCSPACKG